MFYRLFQTGDYMIEAYLTGKSDKISFNECFEIIAPDELQKKLLRTFKIRNDRVFNKVKLQSYESELISLKCTGQVTLTDLKKHLPTVFDYQYIKKHNSELFIKKNKDLIANIASSIIGEENTKNIFNKINN
jgi:hypothetical protein